MPGWGQLAATFLLLGTTCWGGLFASLARVERILVDQRGWVTRDELQQLVALATLVPGPTFIALGGLIGYRLRGLRGAGLCCGLLLLPSALLILALMWVLPPAWAATGMGMVGHTIGIAVGGILFGTALLTAGRSKQMARGLPLALAAMLLMVLGVPTLIVIIAGLVAGRFLLSDPAKPRAPEQTP